MGKWNLNFAGQKSSILEVSQTSGTQFEGLKDFFLGFQVPE